MFQPHYVIMTNAFLEGIRQSQIVLTKNHGYVMKESKWFIHYIDAENKKHIEIDLCLMYDYLMKQHISSSILGKYKASCMHIIS